MGQRLVHGEVREAVAHDHDGGRARSVLGGDRRLQVFAAEFVHEISFGSRAMRQIVFHVQGGVIDRRRRGVDVAAGRIEKMTRCKNGSGREKGTIMAMGEKNGPILRRHRNEPDILQHT